MGERLCACGTSLDSRNVIGKCRACYRAGLRDPSARVAMITGWRRAAQDPRTRTRMIDNLRRASAARIAWCPVEYRDDYRRLLYSKHYSAAQARAAIEELIAADAGRYARTGRLQQSERARQ